MAKRPVFIVSSDESSFFKEEYIEFEWVAGMATSQKQKSVKSLHAASELKGIENILEVSTKSEEVLGNQLSAFNLSVTGPDGRNFPLETAFQGSKVFKNGGPYHDLYDKNPLEVKKDARISKVFVITGFNFQGEIWENEPKTLFYDWLYLNAVNEEIGRDNDLLFKKILDYDAFTDIEFNPKKSINCQARSCAVFVSLVKKNLLQAALQSSEAFLEILSSDPFYQIEKADNSVQGEFNLEI
tara:strand:+ start:843 stop:1565 length:723 start_codon:yes stop_codon:yes gene_type:complete